VALSKAQKQTQQIVDAALELAEQSRWEAVRLHQISAHTGIPLSDIHHLFGEKEDLIDAWFDRADQALLKVANAPGFLTKTMAERLHTLLMAWLDALAGHRKATRDMVWGKLEPGHLHYQINGLLRVSRTVQWWREAAGLTTTLPLRAFEEVALTGIYLATFVYWMCDETENSSATQRFLHDRLEQAGRCRCPTSEVDSKPQVR